MLTDQEYIVLYRSLTEKKFMLGNGEGKLKQRELEYVGNLVEEKSNIKLSISTLKRLWRNDLTQLPHPSTLDALVSILDFKDWQAFKTFHAGQVHAPDIPPHQSKRDVLGRRLPIVVTLGVIILIASFFVLQGFNKKEKGVVISGDVVFSGDKTVTSGVPNTVMFHYDLSGVEADSFFIQQSWNPANKTRIDPEKNYYASIYYTPGFHLARIMANDSILKFVKVHIKTEGWLPLVKYELRDKKHLYPDAKAVHADGILRTTPEILKQANVDLNKDFYLRYYNVRDFEGITSDNFDLETRIKCDSLSYQGRTSKVPCPYMEIMLVMEENVFFVPLTSKGCVGELDLLIGETYKGGKDNDLSAFGTEVFDWQTLRIKNENRKVTILLNDLPIHELEYKKDFGKIKGVIYTFTGQGSIDFLRFKNLKGELVYNDDF